ncbi:MAG: CHASE domain-containing protein, partial [Intrasporangiaceae bacterium]|nr:CHASE domain-containing protein [Intrasporangiaceae bacterium]
MDTDRRSIAVTVVGVLLLTLVATVLVRDAELRDDRSRLEGAATTVATTIERELLRVIDLGVAVEAVLAQAGSLEADTYAALLDALGVPEQYPALLGISFVEVLERDGVPGRVAERQLQGPFDPRADAGESMVRLITFAHPIETNEEALGVDLNLLEDSFAAHDLALQTGEPRLSVATRIVQLADDEPGAVLHVPTTVPGTDRPATIGMVIAGQAFLDELAPFAGGVRVRLDDPGSALFTTVAETNSSGHTTGVSSIRDLEVAGRVWEVQVLAPTGFSLPFLQRGSTYLGMGGMVAAVLLGLLVHGAASREHYAMDLVRQRTTELARVNEELAAANQAKDEFLASVSHELRTPLAVIAGFAELLERAEPEERTDMLIVPIDRNVRRLSRLVEDLLTLASIDAGAAACHPEPVALDDVLPRLPAELVGLIGEEVSVEVEPGLTVEVDPLHLERMLINLLDNAARHGAPPIVVTASSASDGTGLAVIRVRDHGPGVASPALDELFARFARGRDERRHSGTGLG